MMGSLRCKKPFSSSMYHNSNNKKISNKNSNKNNEKKNYNCFTFESSKPNFPALIRSAASAAAAAAPLTATNDHPFPFGRLDALLPSSSPSSPSISPSPMSLAGHDWCRPPPAQDRVYTGLHQPSR